jgi:uncharacterized membrane protein
MSETEIPESELTVEEMTVWPGGWFDIPDSVLTLILHGTAVVGVIIVMLVGMILVFRRLKELGQGFGPNSLKSLGILLFLPSLVLLALLTDFATETLAALLGTVAGYVLSSAEDKSE